MVVLGLILALLTAPAQAPTPVGVWQDTNQRTRVEIAPCGDRLCGKIVWFQWPNNAKGLPLVDRKNSDPALRGRPLLGLQILYGLRSADGRTWKDGRIYNPDDGVNYRATMTLDDDGALRVRAYVLHPLLGKTRVFTRAPAPEAAPGPELDQDQSPRAPQGA